MRIEIAPIIMVRAPDEIDAAFVAMKKGEAGAVVVQGSLSSKNVAELALKHRLPAATVPRSFAEFGGLLAYGADGPESFRRSAVFVVKSLQGGIPKEMPVEQPTKFELVLNLKTAKALDLEIPGSLLEYRGDVAYWHIASFRCCAATTSLWERSGHRLLRGSRDWIHGDTP